MGNGIGVSIREQFTLEKWEEIERDYKLFVEKGLSESDAKDILNLKYKTENVQQDKPSNHHQHNTFRRGESCRDFSRSSLISAHRKVDDDAQSLSNLHMNVNRHKFDELQPLVLSSHSKKIKAGLHLSINSEIVNIPNPVKNKLPPLTIGNDRNKILRAKSCKSFIDEPKCELCNMVFLTVTRHQRHCKESELHAKNMKLLEESAVLTRQGSYDYVKLTGNNASGLNQDDALIYAGSEYFHNTNNILDIYIILRNNINILEIISFNTEENKELNRIYINIPTLIDAIGPSNMRKKLRDMELGIKLNSIGKVSDQNIEKEAARILALIISILSRLQVSQNTDGITTGVVFQIRNDDNNKLDPILHTHDIPQQTNIIRSNSLPFNELKKIKIESLSYLSSLPSLKKIILSDKRQMDDVMKAAKKILALQISL